MEQKRKERVAMLSTFYPFRGGIAQFNALLYRVLEKGGDVKAFTFKRQYPNFLFPGETQYVTPDDNADPIEAEEILDTINPLTYFKTARKIKKWNPDILIIKYWMTFFGPSLGMVAKKLNKNTKRIAIIDNMIPHEKRFFDGMANRFLLKHYDGFVVMSDAVKNDLLSLAPNAKYLRIDHPVYDQFGKKIASETARNILQLPENAKVLLFFGFIRDYKGLDLLIEAMTDLGDDLHLVIAGETYGSFDKYNQLIEKSTAKHRIHVFNKYISDSEVTNYFSAADVCMLPYKDATQSGITAISHNFDLPIIATDVGGLKENILHGENGLIVDRPDSKLIAESVKEYFEKELKDQFTQNIQKEKATNSWENFGAKILEFARGL